MREDELNINKEEVTIKKIVKQEGKFMNEKGVEIEFENYKIMTKIGEYCFVWKLEKPYKEMMKEIIEENKEIL